MSTVIRTERRQRSPWGAFVKWGFVAFNVFMLLWLISGLQAVSEVTAPSEAARVGRAVGAVIGISFILGIWVIGDVILGLFVLLTRGHKVIVEETEGTAFAGGHSAQDLSISPAEADAMIARYLQSQQNAARQPRSSSPPDIKTFGRRR